MVHDLCTAFAVTSLLFAHAGTESEATLRERALAARVSDAKAAEDVRSLVSLGPRMGGTASGDRAAEWLVERFGEFGLKCDVVDGKPQWCHEETSWTVSVEIEGNDEPIVLERAWPWGFSPASEGRAELHLTHEDAAGEALLIERFGRTPRGTDASRVMLVDGATNYDGSFPMCRPHPRRHRAEVPVFGLSNDGGELLRNALSEKKSIEVNWKLEAKIFEAPPKTVAAILPARAGAPEGHFIVCAHGDSDSGGPGANDNASGVAIVLQMARAWSAAIAAGEVDPPAREVRFVIWGSEIASTAHYRDEVGAKSPILGVLNFDQAGFGSTGERMHVEPDDLPANEGFVREAVGVLRDFEEVEGFPARWATNKSLGGTDSYVFSESRAFIDGGLPSVTLFTSAWGRPAEHARTKGMPGESWSERDQVAVDYDLYYHSAGDTPERTTDLEPHNMGWCARVGLVTTLRWLDQIDSAPALRENQDDSDDEGDGKNG